MRVTCAVVLFVTVSVFPACDQPAETYQRTPHDTVRAGRVSVLANSAADHEIAHIVISANATDAEVAQFVLDRIKHLDVRSFAETMLVDHSAAHQQATRLVERLDLMLADNPTSQHMISDGQELKQLLASISAADFDRTYINNEVHFHEQLIDALDNMLIPQAQNTQLKTFLRQIRPAVAAHLQRARQIQQSL